MTPEAAGVLAQIWATLLLALIVGERFRSRRRTYKKIVVGLRTAAAFLAFCALIVNVQQMVTDQPIVAIPLVVNAVAAVPTSYVLGVMISQWQRKHEDDDDAAGVSVPTVDEPPRGTKKGKKSDGKR